MPADNITILVKLFDTLKSSTDKNEETTQELIKQQLDLVNQIKTLPMNDLKQALKEHMKESSKHYDFSKEDANTKLEKILKQLSFISSKVKTMITVVIVAFTLLASSYIFVRAISDTTPNQVNIIKEMIQKQQQENLNHLKEITEKLNEHINKK